MLGPAPCTELTGYMLSKSTFRGDKPPRLASPAAPASSLLSALETQLGRLLLVLSRLALR